MPPVAARNSGIQIRRSSASEDTEGPRFNQATAARLLGGGGKDICLLFSQEFDGLYKNGGIGTYYRQVAKTFREDGWYVILVNLGLPTDCEVPSSVDVDIILHAHNFTKHVEADGDTASVLKQMHDDWESETSLKCLAYTRASIRLFPDQRIYAEFPEMCAPGYDTAKASESGMLGKNCIIGITMHSGHEWIFEANGAITTQRTDRFLHVSTREEHSFSSADLPMFPSDSLYRTVESFGWRLEKARKLPYLVPEV